MNAPNQEARGGLTRYLPILSWLRGYDRTNLRPDIIAGVTVWALLVPEAMAYASLAGLPPEAGLYAALPPLVLYAIFGTFQSETLGAYAMPFAIIAAAGAILTAGYILWLLQRVYLGEERPEYKSYPDLNRREILVLIPMAVLCVVLGILPKQALFDFVSPVLQGILDLL